MGQVPGTVEALLAAGTLLLLVLAMGVAMVIKDLVMVLRLRLLEREERLLRARLMKALQVPRPQPKVQPLPRPDLVPTTFSKPSVA